MKNLKKISRKELKDIKRWRSF
ncbi:bacteriocin-like protein [Chryseobacterium indoltheticum]